MATITQRGLGKGLSALISENYVQPATKPAPSTTGGVYTLPVAQLKPGRFQPRTRFDDATLSELAESIRRNGIMQPIIVRPDSRHAGQYEIIAGERRWRAAQMAGAEEIPVLVREITDRQALELALVENVQRQDLSPLEEAHGYQRLMEEFDYTQEELSSIIGKSRSHVANLLRLLSLPEEVQAMIEKGELTAGHARTLIGMPNAVELARLIARKQLNVRQTEQYVRDVQGVSKRERSGKTSARVPMAQPAGEKHPDILALEETLSENLGLKVSINDRGQSGEIVIAYDSLSQLDEILRRLGDGI